MADNKQPLARLKKKYGAKAINNGLRINPGDFLDMLTWRDELDPHYAKLWLDYTYGGLYQRGVLSERARAGGDLAGGGAGRNGSRRKPHPQRA